MDEPRGSGTTLRATFSGLATELSVPDCPEEPEEPPEVGHVIFWTLSSIFDPGGTETEPLFGPDVKLTAVGAAKLVVEPPGSLLWLQPDSAIATNSRNPARRANFLMTTCLS